MDFSLFSIIFLNGIAYGSLLFLVASGFNLVFGVLRILNLAHGSFYMVGAYFTFQFVFSFNNFWLALTLVPLLVACVGVAIEYFLLRQVYRLEITFQLLITFAFGLILADAVKIVWGAYFRSVPSPDILSRSVVIFGRMYPLNNLFIIICAFLVVVIMWYLLNRTMLGWRVKAASQNGELANALGINVPLLYTGVFGLAAFLAGLGGVVAVLNRSLTLTMGSDILVEALVVIVVGGLGSFWGALLSALLLGEVHALATMFAPRLELVLLFALMVLVLMIRPRGLFGGKAPPFIRWEILKIDVRKTVSRGFPRASTVTFPLYVFLILAVFSLFIGPVYLTDFQILFLNELLILALFALSYNLVLGYGGMLSFGHAAFFALGSYTCSFILLKMTPSMILGLLGAFAVGGMAGWVMGYLCKRANEVYLSMLTLAFSLLVYAYLVKYVSVVVGVPRPPIEFLGIVINISSAYGYYYFTLVVVTFSVLVLWRIVRSPFGLTLRALRQNSSRVEFLGIPSARYRLAAFVISGAFSGVSGALFAPFLRISHYQFGSWTKSMEPILMSLLGGTQSFLGPAVGAVIFTGLKEALSTRFELYWMMILGILLIAVIILFPEGIAESIKRWFHYRSSMERG
ncbi:MAG: hypothetical protein GTN81_15865 [Proteobacteria bacterium]|nr:hypothetical protein [Pseudomonadota bacterium]